MIKRTAAIAIALAFLIASCAAPPKQKIDSIYTGLQELLPRFDPAVLSGRIVAIDPGHGGFFKGTSGNDGLEEASVNLGVALYLGGLLREAGATVYFTRSADKDFLTPEDSSLTTDLARRIAFVDSVSPDIFVSIHHNAQSLRDPSKNAIETYYKFGDPASRDLAIAVHRHLMRNLGIPNGEVRQGNYYVLRKASVPAILGEASYLTNPAVEDKLRLSEKQKLEAEAYYLGILDYFRRGTPRIAFVAPRETTFMTIPDLRFTAEDVGGIGIDPDAVFLNINDEPVAASSERNGRAIVYSLPWDAPNGRYDVSLSLRNLMGNSSMRATCSFTIDLPPELCLFENKPDFPPRNWGLVRVRAALLDRRGMRIADGSTARILTSPTHDTLSVFPRTVPVSDGRIEFYIDPAGDPDSIAVIVQCRGRSFHHTVKRGTAETASASQSLRKVITLDSTTRLTIAGVSLLCRDSVIATGTDDGILFVPNDIDIAQTLVRAPGYQPLRDWDGADSLSLKPWFGATLHGKKFVLDPQGGSRTAAGVGLLGLPATHVNLQVARYCASFLRQAGASVMLTRSSEETATPQDIVAMTNRFGADRYIEIRHHHSSPGGIPVDRAAIRTYCFPGSRVGSMFAEQMARSFSDYFALPDASAGSQVTYPLQQTACPAIVIEPPSIEATDEELRLGEPWYLRQQAYALFLGILDHFAVPDHGELLVQIDAVRDKTNWLVTLDETWNLLSSPDGLARFEALAPGSHSLSIRKRGVYLRRQIDIISGEIETITIFPTSDRP